eukprot:2468517-Rhodomonas_salina.1
MFLLPCMIRAQGFAYTPNPNPLFHVHVLFSDLRFLECSLSWSSVPRNGPLPDTPFHGMAATPSAFSFSVTWNGPSNSQPSLLLAPGLCTLPAPKYSDPGQCFR